MILIASKYLGSVLIALAVIFFITGKLTRRFHSLPRKKRILSIRSILRPEHYWAEADHTGFYRCCVCKHVGWNLFKTVFNECVVCGSVKHFSCHEDGKTKCKVISADATYIPNSHQWVQGNLPLNCICDACGVICGSIYGLEAATCVWCQRVVHEDCLKKTAEVCDFGALVDAIIPPSRVKITERASSGETKVTTKKEKQNGDEIDSSNLKCVIEPGTKAPIVAIVNKRSGGQKGANMLATFYKHLNPIQVIDLIDEGLDRLQDFKAIDNLKLIVGGGDGTISRVIDKIKSDIQTTSEKESKFKVPIAILPLGTGNDLSRSLGWGGGVNVPDAKDVILDVLHNSEPVLLDRWIVVIEDLAQNKDQRIVKKTMLNYFGVGLDAKIALDFQNRRDKYPFLFKSRYVNKLIYTEVGTRDLFFEKSLFLSKRISLTCDGEAISLEGLEGIVILNIDYWGGGIYNIWGDLKKATESDDEEKVDKKKNALAENRRPKREYKKPSICDGIIEVIGFHNFFQMGMSQSRMTKGIRVCQGSKIEIAVVDKDLIFPIQIDGEPAAISSPFKITVDTVEKVNMLTRKTYKRLQNESRIVKVLDSLEARQEISTHQKEILIDELIKGIST